MATQYVLVKPASPSGLTITRNKNKFTFSWKRSGSPDAQQLAWRRTYDGKWGDWKSLTVNSTATTKSISLDWSDYYPTKKVMGKLQFRVRGKKEKKWSNWAVKEFDILLPNVPKVTAEFSDDYSNVTTFSWNVTTSDTNAKVFYDVQWQSILQDGYNDKEIKAISNWSTLYGYQTGTSQLASSSKTITEISSDIDEGSHTRWFRARARGPQGVSEWGYGKHVYAKANQAIITAVKATPIVGGTLVNVAWSVDTQSSAFPIDSVVVQYSLAVPAAGMTFPSGGSWTEADTSSDNGKTGAATFEVNSELDEDECLWVKVDTIRDGKTTNGVPTICRFGVLAEPTNLSVSTDNTTYRATVTCTNNSSVPDSFLAVKYCSTSNPQGLVLGIIPHSSSSVTMQCPDWTDETAIAFEVYAVQGNYTSTTTSGITEYRINPNMKSGSISDGGAVPVAPTNVTATPTDEVGTVQIRWDWTWTEADGAELTWSDYEYAWESTGEPSRYEVDNIHTSQWNVTDLEPGKKWYFRVRLFSSDGNEKTYGAYSETKSVDLSTAPTTPILMLSKGVIQEDGMTTATWAFMSTDGTSQMYAEICEATYSSGQLVYGDIIASTTSAQHIDLYAKEVGWHAGEVHYLCLRVQSASGKLSDSWSDPVPVIIAEPMTCTITNTSLVPTEIAVNPRYFASAPIVSFDTEMEEEVIKLEVSLEPVQDDTPWMSAQDTEPYMFRAVPPQTEDFGHESDCIVGGTVGWNQLVEAQSTATVNNGVTFTGNGDGSITLTNTATGLAYRNLSVDIISGHKYFLCGGKSASIYTILAPQASWSGTRAEYGTGVIASCIASASGNVSIQVTNGTETGGVKVYPQLFDLTAYFGTTIADYVYTLESGTAGAGVAWLRANAPQLFEYHAYDSGSLVSVSGLTSHDMVGFNQWDEAWESGSISTTTGENVSNSNKIRSTNYIKVIPTFSYYNYGYAIDVYRYDSNKVYIDHSTVQVGTFIVPSDTHYIRFTRTATTYNNDICINISDASLNGTYKPYTKHSYPLDGTLTLRGIPKLDASNNLYYDGDVYSPSGEVSRKFIEHTCDGTDGWFSEVSQQTTADGTAYVAYINKANKGLALTSGFMAVSNRFVFHPNTSGLTALHKGEFNGAGSYMRFVLAHSSITTLEQLNTWLASNPITIVCELAAPTTEQADPYTNPQIVDPSGTEEYVGSPIPVGHSTTYQRICPISGWTGCEVTQAGVNLLDPQTIVTGKYYNVSLVEVTNAGKAHSDIIQIKPNTSYCLNGFAGSGIYSMLALDENKQPLARWYGGASKTEPFVATTPASARYMILNFNTDQISTIAFYESSTVQGYIPYNGTTYPVSWQTEAGTVYGGTVDLVTGVLTVDRASVDLSTLTWSARPAWGGFHSVSIASDVKRPPTTSTLLANCKCSTYNQTTSAAIDMRTLYSYAIDIDGAVLLRMEDGKTASDITGQLVYPLATPTTYQLDPVQVACLLGQNNVWADCGDVAVNIAEDVISVDALTELPLSVTVSGAGDAGAVNVAIERADNYFLARPNGSQFVGYQGETVALGTRSGDGTVTFDSDNIIGMLDDGAHYRIVATTNDLLGQSATDSLDFWVVWEHQALMPTATITFDDEIALITPIAPTGTQTGDTCDIYRLSADKPELIVSGASFGTQYVDPYPTLGDFGGYRIVFKSMYGDYITADNILAWADYGKEDGAYFYTPETIIDFMGQQVRVMLDMTLTGEWGKDFKATQYLGGSTKGDWNPAVGRTGTVNATTLRPLDADTIESLHDLADYAGICKVRMPDGTNVHANVDVSLSSNWGNSPRTTECTLSFTRVDSETLDGLTYAEWNEGNT